MRNYQPLLASRYQSARSGFSLVELLAIIALIALMAGFSIAGLSQGRSKSRDDRRIADAKLIQSSLELYRIDIDRQANPALVNVTYPYPIRARDGGALTGPGIYNNPLFSQYLTTPPQDPLRKKPYVYFAPGCLRPGAGTVESPAVISPAKDLLFHTATEIQTGGAGQFCPAGSGWLPYVIYLSLETPRSTAQQQQGLVNLANSNQRAVVYSVTRPLFRNGETGLDAFTTDQSFCAPVPAGLSCPDGYSN